MNHIKTLIINGELIEALDAMEKAFPKKQNEVILLKARLNSLKNDQLKGIISQENAELRENRLRDAIMQYLSTWAPASSGSNSPYGLERQSPQTSVSGRKKIFFSYSKHDREFLEQLQRHMSVLTREGKIEPWDDQKILPGEDWDDAIKDNLREADIILLLISVDFLSTTYIWDVEISTAMHRHERGDARVVPIILRHCDWHSAPFGKLNGLPRKGRPIKDFQDRDEAWTEVVKELRKII